MTSNLEAARSADRRAALEAVRDTLAEAIDAAVSKGDGTVAQLVAQYRATLADLAALGDGSEKGSALDEIAARRAARNGVAADRPRAARGGKSGDG